MTWRFVAMRRLIKVVDWEVENGGVRDVMDTTMDMNSFRATSS